MSEEQFEELMTVLRVINTGVHQLIDIQMLQLQEINPEEAMKVDAVHNKYGKFMTDDSWLEDAYEDGLVDRLPDQME